MTLTISRATCADIAALAYAGREFFAESSMSITNDLDDSTMYASIQSMVMADDYIVLIAKDGDLPAGFISWQLEKLWTKQVTATLGMFYVRKRYRNGKISKCLLDISLKMCEDRGASVFYAASLAGLDDKGINERAFMSYFSKKGFRAIGKLLSRSD